MRGNYLITTDEWFLAPDGKQYRAVWGNVEILEDSIFGIKTNRGSSNWFAKVGSEENHVIVSGCRIHYAAKCNQQPHIGPTEEYSVKEGDGGLNFHRRPTLIWIANGR